MLKNILRFSPSILFTVVGSYSIFFDSWAKFFVPTMHPVFADLRSITATSECYLTDPSWTFNSESCDPWGRQFNYPIIWLKIFSTLGFTEQYTFELGLSFFLLLALSLLYWNLQIISQKFHIWQPVLLGAIYISPPILLLAERGNTDALIFAFTTLLVLITSGRATFLSLIAFAGLAYLKIFVISALVTSLYQKFDLKRVVFSISLVFLIIWHLRQDLFYIRSFTSYSFWTSFGVNVIPMGLGNILSIKLNNFQNFSLGLILLFSAIILLSKICRNYYFKIDSKQFKSDKNYNSLVLYAGILITVFFLGTSYDYRLVFIVPILQLISSNLDSDFRKKILGIVIFMVMYLSRLGVLSILGDIIFLFLMSHLILLFYFTIFPKLTFRSILKSVQNLFVK